MNIQVSEQGTIPLDMIYVILAVFFSFFRPSHQHRRQRFPWRKAALDPESSSGPYFDIFWSKYMLNILLMVPVSILAIIAVGLRRECRSRNSGPCRCDFASGHTDVFCGPDNEPLVPPL
jgi:hypothetical protein